MPSPSTALTTLRPDLAGSFMEYDLATRMKGFIAARVLPVLDVGKASGQFGLIPIEQLLQERDTARAPGAGYSRGKWKFKNATFATGEHGAEEPVDDNESAMYREFFDAEQISAMRAFDAVLTNAEKRAAAAIFNTTVWTGSDLTTAASAKWDIVGTKVVADVKAARQKVWDGAGIWANAIIMNRIVFHELRNNTEIMDRVQSAGAGDQTRATDMSIAQMAAVFDLDHVIVADSARNSAAEGQSVSVAPIWSSTLVMICRIALTQDIREPAIGRTFHWSEDGSEIGGHVESYRDEPVRSDIIRVRHQVEEKILYIKAGHLINTVT